MIEEVLDKKNIRYIPKGKDLLVSCFNPEHDDSSPSMRIDRETGVYHCLSCGYKGNLLNDFSIVKRITTEKVQNLQKEILNLRRNRSIDYPPDSFAYEDACRGVSKETIVKYLAFTSEKQFHDRICFPIFDNVGSLKGIVGRYINTDISPKYIAYPKEVSLPIYPQPSILARKSTDLILVEGLFDMLKLQDLGVHDVSCIFGTKLITKDNVEDNFEPFIFAGYERVILLLDGDKAGRRAADNLEYLIKYKTKLLVKKITLPEDKDPGSFNSEDVETLLYAITHDNN